jgi:hypothetical protein
MTHPKTPSREKSSFNQLPDDLKYKVLSMGQGSDRLIVETQSTLRKQPQPLGPEHFTVIEEHGMKFITTKSPHTQTVIEHDLPLMADEIDLGRIYWKRLRSAGHDPHAQDVRRRFPSLDFYCADLEIEKLMNTTSTNSRSEAKDILRTLTDMQEGTMDRYSRKKSVLRT